MNKLTKLGASALCGSLAAISAAHAGDLSVTGGVDMSWTSLSKDTSGNPIGIGSDLAFKGSGELDNGIGVALAVAHANANGYSATNVTLTFPTMGSLIITQGVSGTGIDRYDDVIPTAWEEAYGAGLGTGIDTVGGASAGAGIEWTPSSDMMPEGITARIAYSPKADGSKAGDKSVATSDSVVESGYDIIIEADGGALGFDGLTLYGGMSQIEQATTGTVSGDHSQYTWAAKYAAGGFTVGYQYSRDNLQQRTGTNYYENTGYGIVFAVNDDLSLSYGNYESEKNATSGANVTTKATSVQIAYSMGGASIRLAENDVDNGSYTSGSTKDKDGRTLSLALAF